VTVGISTRSTGLVLNGEVNRGSVAPTTLVDKSRYGNDGTIDGATWVREPSGLWGLRFGPVADDYVSCGTDASITGLTTAITVEVWFNAPANADTVVISNQKTDAMPVWRIFIYANLVRFDIAASKYALNAYAGNTWTHVVATYDKVKLRIAVNGVQTDGDAYTTNIVTGTTVELGRRKKNDNTYDSYFVGYQALPRIYNRALSATEILNHFNREKHLFGV